MANNGTVDCKFSDLDTTLFSIIKDFAEECTEELNEAMKDTTEYTLDELKGYIPNGAGHYQNWGKYLKGWTAKEDYRASTNHTTYTIWNPKKYMLTHLLEKGHVIAANGKRTREFPHISVAFEKGMKHLDHEIQKRSNR